MRRETNRRSKAEGKRERGEWSRGAGGGGGPGHIRGRPILRSVSRKAKMVMAEVGSFYSARLGTGKNGDKEENGEAKKDRKNNSEIKNIYCL